MGSFLRKRDEGLEELHEAMATATEQGDTGKLLSLANNIGLACHEMRVALKQKTADIEYYRVGKGSYTDLGGRSMSNSESNRAKEILKEMESFKKQIDAFEKKVVGLAMAK